MSDVTPDIDSPNPKAHEAALAAGMVDEAERDRVMDLFGVKYWQAGECAVYRAPENNLYDYTAYIGVHEFEVERGDSVFYLKKTEDELELFRMSGRAEVRSEHMAIVIRGYMPDDAIRVLGPNSTRLPYVNGCSTKQVFSPERNGDPTLQYLLIPPFSAEQAHHIHSTVRVVYVWRGKGRSIVGMEGKEVITELLPGMVAILEPMCPHHFDTPQGESIEVIPFHVWSSGPGENNHPMMRGTHLMDQGG